jgi:hypothetical protein
MTIFWECTRLSIKRMLATWPTRSPVRYASDSSSTRPSSPSPWRMVRVSPKVSRSKKPPAKLKTFCRFSVPARPRSFFLPSPPGPPGREAGGDGEIRGETKLPHPQTFSRGERGDKTPSPGGRGETKPPHPQPPPTPLPRVWGRGGKMDSTGLSRTVNATVWEMGTGAFLQIQGRQRVVIPRL